MLEIYTRQNNFDLLLNTLIQLAEYEEDPKDKLKYFYNAAEVLNQTVSTDTIGMDIYSKIFELNPSDIENARRLGQMEYSMSNWDRMHANKR